MKTFHLDEEGYLAWHNSHSPAFVLNRFGGSNPAFNVLHRSDCTFLWRTIDEGSRTAIEKWCSKSEDQLGQHADSVLGKGMWKRCGVCFRTLHPPTPAANQPQFVVAIPTSPVPNASQFMEPFWVQSEPAVWLGSGEKEWKTLITTALKAVTPTERPQWIDVEFRFLPERLYRKDIDNLITPILESARDGGWIEKGFAWLGSVTARKVAVADQSQVGVQMRFAKTPPVLCNNRIGILIEAATPRLDESTVKWALYERAFALYQQRPELRFSPQTPMTLEIRVTIDDAANRKSIAALLKPCIDGLEPILGHPSNLLPVPRETIDRRLAPQDEMVLALDFHVRGGTTSEVSAVISPLLTDNQALSN